MVCALIAGCSKAPCVPCYVFSRMESIDSAVIPRDTLWGVPSTNLDRSPYEACPDATVGTGYSISGHPNYTALSNNNFGNNYPETINPYSNFYCPHWPDTFGFSVNPPPLASREWCSEDLLSFDYQRLIFIPVPSLTLRRTKILEFCYTVCHVDRRETSGYRKEYNAET